jgi:hypothetical protein
VPSQTGEKARAVAEQSQKTQRAVGTNQHSEGHDTENNDVMTLSPQGNSATYAERRLRKGGEIFKLRGEWLNDRTSRGKFQSTWVSVSLPPCRPYRCAFQLPHLGQLIFGEHGTAAYPTIAAMASASVVTAARFSASMSYLS